MRLYSRDRVTQVLFGYYAAGPVGSRSIRDLALHLGASRAQLAEIHRDLAELGWVVGAAESAAPGLPPRRVYRPTTYGIMRIREALLLGVFTKASFGSKACGHTHGRDLTDDTAQQLADEAVTGYDLDRLRPLRSHLYGERESGHDDAA